MFFTLPSRTDVLSRAVKMGTALLPTWWDTMEAKGPCERSATMIKCSLSADALPKLRLCAVQVNVRGACECEEGPAGGGARFSARNVRRLPDEPAGEQRNGRWFCFFSHLPEAVIKK